MPEPIRDESGHTPSLRGEPDEPLRDEPLTPEVVASEVPFSGRVWNVRRDTFRYGGENIVREYVAHPGAVAVLARDSAGRVLLIQQYRHPVRTREWELPAGLLDVVGEDPLVAAKRELAEEADLAAETWTELISFHTTPGGSSELIRVYLAEGLSQLDAFAREAEEADIRKAWAELDDVVAGIMSGRLRNAILQIAVLAAHAKR